MSVARPKVESKAINVVRCLVDESDRLLPDPAFGDKGVSTDGCIQLFKNTETDKGENLLREIKIQIKGRTDKTKSLTRIDKNRIREKVEVKDLQNYSRSGGAIYFIIYFDTTYERHTVYYSVLLPVKIQSYLNIARNARSKTVSVAFDKLRETGDEIFAICAQFYAEQKNQGFGDGQLLEHLISWSDLQGITTLSATAIGASNEMEFLKKISRGDVYLYAKVGDFNIPLEWKEGGIFVKRVHIDDAVMIEDRQYFDSFDVEVSTENEKGIIYIGKCLKFDFGTNKYIFTETGMKLVELAEAAEFILALGQNPTFSVGKAQITLNGFRLDKDTENRMLYYKKLNMILEQIGIDMNHSPFGDIDIHVRDQLRLLVDIVERRKDTYFVEKYTHFDWEIAGKAYPLIVIRGEKDEQNEIYSFLFAKEYQTFCEGDDNKHYAVPTFAFPSYSVMKRLYYYDIVPIEEQFNRMDINPYTCEYINVGALKLISMFDSTGDERLLTLSDRALQSIEKIYEIPEYIILNRLQIKKRRSKLSDCDTKLLVKLLNSNNRITCFGAAVLLGEKERAITEIDKINKKEWDELIDTPLHYLYEILCG